MFHGNFDSTSPTKIIFPYGIEAKFIRLYPQTWVNKIAMKLELFGCTKPYSVSTPVQLSTTARTTVSQISSLDFGDNIFGSSYSQLQSLHQKFSSIVITDISASEQQLLADTKSALKVLLTSFEAKSKEYDQQGYLSQQSLISFSNDKEILFNIKNGISNLDFSKLGNAYNKDADIKQIDTIIKSVDSFSIEQVRKDNSFFAEKSSELNQLLSAMNNVNLNSQYSSNLSAIKQSLIDIEYTFKNFNQLISVNGKLNRDDEKSLLEKINELKEVETSFGVLMSMSGNNRYINDDYNSKFSKLISSLTDYSNSFEHSQSSSFTKITSLGSSMKKTANSFSSLIINGLIKNEISSETAREMKSKYDRLTFLAHQVEDAHTDESKQNLEKLANDIKEELGSMTNLLIENKANIKDTLGGSLLKEIETLNTFSSAFGQEIKQNVYGSQTIISTNQKVSTNLVTSEVKQFVEKSSRLIDLGLTNSQLSEEMANKFKGNFDMIKHLTKQLESSQGDLLKSQQISNEINTKLSLIKSDMNSNKDFIQSNLWNSLNKEVESLSNFNVGVDVSSLTLDKFVNTALVKINNSTGKLSRLVDIGQSNNEITSQTATEVKKKYERLVYLSNQMKNNIGNPLKMQQFTSEFDAEVKLMKNAIDINKGNVKGTLWNSLNTEIEFLTNLSSGFKRQVDVGSVTRDKVNIMSHKFKESTSKCSRLVDTGLNNNQLSLQTTEQIKKKFERLTYLTEQMQKSNEDPQIIGQLSKEVDAEISLLKSIMIDDQENIESNLWNSLNNEINSLSTISSGFTNKTEQTSSSVKSDSQRSVDTLEAVEMISNNFKTSTNKFSRLVDLGLTSDAIPVQVAELVKSKVKRLTDLTAQIEELNADPEKVKEISTLIKNEANLVKDILAQTQVNMDDSLWNSLKTEITTIENTASKLEVVVSTTNTSSKDFFDEVRQEVEDMNTMLGEVGRESEEDPVMMTSFLEMMRDMSQTIAELESYKQKSQLQGHLDRVSLQNMKSEIERLQNVKTHLQSQQLNQGLNIATVNKLQKITIKNEIVIQNLVQYVTKNIFTGKYFGFDLNNLPTK